MAVDTVDQLSHWLEPLIQSLTPAARTALARRLAVDLRRGQAERIAAQANPDGSPFAARSRRPASVAAAERRRVKGMFQRLRTARHLKTRANSDTAAVAILDRAARIARVHQYGLTDQTQPGGPSVRYPAREILGFSPADIDRIQSTVLDHLAG